MKQAKTIGLLVLAATAFGARAQKSKPMSEGKVVFEITYENADLPPEHAAMMPKQLVTYLKKDRSRTEMNSAMGMRQVYIYDYKAQTMTALMDIMGRKMSVQYDAAQVKKQNRAEKGDFKIEKTDKTREIAGYLCKHAIIKSKDGDFDLYYAPDIVLKNDEWAREFEGIDGFPLQYHMVQEGMEMTLTATEVMAQKVDDSLFAIPEGYTKMTPEEMMKAFGQE